VIERGDKGAAKLIQDTFDINTEMLKKNAG
jgi:hypothetical protein